MGHDWVTVAPTKSECAKKAGFIPKEPATVSPAFHAIPHRQAKSPERDSNS
jgi:hypothetical protein